ncbi:MAG: EamA family transporter [Caldithrix sp.]|nr:EamA family transporter [Caldithrix sp.]
MIYLIIVSVLWAFSFGLIKGQLIGLDSNLVSVIRLGISLVVFLPFLRIKQLGVGLAIKLLIIGMIQYGLMYSLYIYAYQFLQAYQVVLFTIFTPLYVTLINDILQKQWNSRFMLAALLAVGGTGFVVFQDWQQVSLRTGFLLMQLSNLCFAFGQIAYKRVMSYRTDIKEHRVFAVLFMGGVIITAWASFFTVEWYTLEVSSTQLYTLLYLGVIASGVGFFLWNYGARRTNAGALAVLNNAKIPLGVLFALVIFNEDAQIFKLIIGIVSILLALYLTERGTHIPLIKSSILKEER